MGNFKKRLNSDKAATGSVETILLIAVAVFAVIAIINYILKPLTNSAKNIGEEIENMGN